MFEEKTKRIIWSILSIMAGLLILINLIFYDPSRSSLHTYPPQIQPHNYIGRVGTFIATYLYLVLGIGAFLLPFFLLWVGIKKIKEEKVKGFFSKSLGFFIFLIAFCSSLYLLGLDVSSFRQGGGVLGLYFSGGFLSLFGKLGSPLLLVGLFIISFLLVIDFSPFLAKRKIRKEFAVKKRISPSLHGEKERKSLEKETLNLATGSYNPPLSLLNLSPPQRKTEDEVKTAGEKLKQTLKDFSVEVEIAEVKEGPAIVRYEIKLAPGTKVSRITSLSNDLALSLAVPGVRIEVPVSGKSLVGIEVPKKKVNFVYLRELLTEDMFKKSKADLFFPLGKDIAGETVWVNLESLPHLLIGGSTGSGKSVCINSIIISILYKSSPEKVKFLLIDPKTVELVDYTGIPHLIFPTIKEVKEANSALEWAVREMKRRYGKFNEMGVRNIQGFNKEVEKRGEPTITYLVIVIDELADLMMVAGVRLEKTICRIAQLGRAAGIHLIVATQRPSVDVITGLIKANFPSRISFAVASQIDSRTILDTTGAEKLVGHGDMLYSPVEAPSPFRVQGSYVSPAEVKKVVSFLKEQGEPDYLEDITKEEEERELESEGEKDEFYEEAKELVIQMGKASTSLLQRRLSIGYNRAGRIMDELEREGIVGPPRGSKAREVLMKGK